MRIGYGSVLDTQLSEFRWYAIYTRHQHEKSVAQILTAKGFETFLPLHSSAHHWKDRTKILSLPLFPCYVFLNGDLEHGRLQIVTTPGVHGVVSSGGQPAPIPIIEIEGIQRVVESGARIEPHPYIKCGNWMRVKYGPLTGIEGILVRKKNMYRLVLSVKMLGKAVSVEVDAYQTEPVKAVHFTKGSGGGHRAGSQYVI